MVLGLHLASQPRRKCWGQADPRKGALSMLKGELQVWSWVPRGPRPQHSWEMGVARMLGRLRGFDTVKASFQWSHHTKTDMRITQRHGLHSTPRVSTNSPSADTTGLPQPAPGTSPRRFSPPQSQAPSVWPLPSWPSSCSPGARLGGHPGPCTRWLPRASYSETCPSGNSGSWD